MTCNRYYYENIINEEYINILSLHYKYYLSYHKNLVKLKIVWLSKIFKMTYNLV
jgi:hypothetical protein